MLEYDGVWAVEMLMAAVLMPGSPPVKSALIFVVVSKAKLKPQ
jgi:hypothetical protein